MKKTTAQARLEKLADAKIVSKSSVAYKMVCEWLEDCDSAILIRPCYVTGHGRFSKNADYTASVCKMCDAIRLRYEAGNDAPRGGACGNWIKIITKFDEAAQIKAAKAAAAAAEKEAIAAVLAKKQAQEEESYTSAKDIDFSFVDAEGWKNANTKGRRYIAHLAAAKVGIVNNAGFFRALENFMKK